jgi:hypothetical protein
MIGRSALAALAVVAPGIASASHRCHETSNVVGYQRCSGFGWWTGGAGLAWELGASLLRIGPELIDAKASASTAGGTVDYHVHADPQDSRALVAEGARVRALVSLGRSLYIGSDVSIGPITRGPRLVADVSSRGITQTVPAAGGGIVMQMVWAFGMRRRVGSFTLGAELAPGMRIATYSSSGLSSMPIRPPGQAWFVFDVQPAISYWLTPNVSLAAIGGIDFIHPDAASAGLVLGLHLAPYDGVR